MPKQGKITRIINNNVIVSHIRGKEVVYMGSGLAYGKRPGDTFDMSKIEKTFVLKTPGQKSQFAELLEQVSPEVLTCTARVIERIEKESDLTFGPMTFIALADHISYSLLRKKEGQELPNKLLNEIKRFYPKEIELGRLAISVIQENTGVYLNDNEAGFIAVHLINAMGKDDAPTGIDKIKLVDQIIRIIEDYFQRKFDEESLYYQRLVTHLKFFAARIFDGIQDSSGDDFFFRVSKVQYPELHKCVALIQENIEYNYHVTIGKEEKGYLIMHLSMLLGKMDKQEKGGGYHGL